MKGIILAGGSGTRLSITGGADSASSQGCTIRQVEILSNKLLTTAFEASFGCMAVTSYAKRRQQGNGK